MAMLDRIREFMFGKKTKEAPSAQRDPKKVQIKKVGQALGVQGAGGQFEESVVDLNEIQRAYNTDSYIKRAVDKYSELMFKAGWEIAGKNEAASEYVWMRFKLMSEATGQPIEEMFTDIASDLVLYGNAFVVKARQKNGGAVSGVSAVGYTGKQPIAGYFVLPAATIQISRDPSGKILSYQQNVGTGQAIPIKPEDMVHFYYKKPRGRAFGIPYIFPTLDDVKMLRQIEENIARLIYRNLFPLYQYQVGIDKPGFEATDDEIDDIRDQIRDMPMDGGIVVPERHNITVVGSQNSALDASEYLKYFRQRVFTGLGVSDIVMGIGNTANRGTADNLSSEMIDGVKEFQRIFLTTFTTKIVNEILFEGGFDPILNVDDEVQFVFSEIELDAKTKKENHIVQMFTQNAITHDEMRQLLGLDPVSDEERLYFNMITASLNAQAAEVANAAANAQGGNKDQPANQHGKKPSPGKPKRSKQGTEPELEEEIKENLDLISPNVLTSTNEMVNLQTELTINSYVNSFHRAWEASREDVIAMVKQGKSIEFIKGLSIQVMKQSMIMNTEQSLRESFQNGAYDARTELNFRGATRSYHEVNQVLAKAKSHIERLVDDVIKLVETSLQEETMDNKLSRITGAFNSNKYRATLIARTELYRAYNYGRALVAKDAGLSEVTFVVESDCVTCKSLSETSIDLSSPDLFETIPPHHPNCTCVIELKTQ